MRPSVIGYSRRMRLPSTTPQPAAASAGSMCSALVSASFISGLHQFEHHLVASERNIRRHRQGAPDSLVVFMGDNHTEHGLPFLGQFILHETHVTERLTHDRITGPTFLQFHNK